MCRFWAGRILKKFKTTRSAIFWIFMITARARWSPWIDPLKALTIQLGAHNSGSLNAQFWWRNANGSRPLDRKSFLNKICRILAGRISKKWEAAFFEFSFEFQGKTEFRSRSCVTECYGCCLLTSNGRRPKQKQPMIIANTSSFHTSSFQNELVNSFWTLNWTSLC